MANFTLQQEEAAIKRLMGECRGKDDLQRHRDELNKLTALQHEYSLLCTIHCLNYSEYSTQRSHIMIIGMR